MCIRDSVKRRRAGRRLEVRLPDELLMVRADSRLIQQAVSYTHLLIEDGSDTKQFKGTGFCPSLFLCAPCFAAMGAIKREMNSTKWTLSLIHI